MARSISSEAARPARESWSRLGAIVRMGFLLYLGNAPFRILLSAVWPRIVLRAVFWVFVGKAVNASVAAAFLYVGLTAVTPVHSGVITMSDVTVEDKWMGTYTRLLGAVVPLPWIFFARGVAHYAASLAELLLVVVVAGLLAGQGGTMVELPRLLPLYLVIALSCSAAGLACAAASVGKRAEVAIYNGFAVLIELCSGAMIPRGRIAAFDAIGTVLPVTHGLAGIRAALDGGSWGGHFLLEAATFGGWAVLAYVLISGQGRRSRRTGTDSYS